MKKKYILFGLTIHPPRRIGIDFNMIIWVVSGYISFFSLSINIIQAYLRGDKKSFINASTVVALYYDVKILVVIKSNSYFLYKVEFFSRNMQKLKMGADSESNVVHKIDVVKKRSRRICKISIVSVIMLKKIWYMNLHDSCLP